MLLHRRILVVDQDDDSRSLLDYALRVERADVLLASSASQALDLVGCYKPHIILTDIALPGEDGFMLLRQVRQMSWGWIKRVPIVAVTGFVTCNVVAETQQAGFQDCLFKPIDLDGLIQTVCHLTSPKLVDFDRRDCHSKSNFFEPAF